MKWPHWNSQAARNQRRSFQTGRTLIESVDHDHDHNHWFIGHQLCLLLTHNAHSYPHRGTARQYRLSNHNHPFLSHQSTIDQKRQITTPTLTLHPGGVHALRYTKNIQLVPRPYGLHNRLRITLQAPQEVHSLHILAICSRGTRQRPPSRVSPFSYKSSFHRAILAPIEILHCSCGPPERLPQYIFHSRHRPYRIYQKWDPFYLQFGFSHPTQMDLNNHTFKVNRVKVLHTIHNYLIVQHHFHKTNPLIHENSRLQYANTILTSPYCMNYSYIVQLNYCEGTLRNLDPRKNYFLFSPL